MKYEKIIKNVFRRYLMAKGYRFTSLNLDELVETYLDCQEWEEENLLTGTTEFEMLDWIKHTAEVDRVLYGNNQIA